MGKVTLQESCQMMFRDYPDVVTVEQVRAMLGGAGRRSVYRLLSSGQIASVRIGRVYRIPKLAVVAYLCRGSQPSA